MRRYCSRHQEKYWIGCLSCIAEEKKRLGGVEEDSISLQLLNEAVIPDADDSTNVDES